MAVSYYERAGALARDLAWLATSRATSQLDVPGRDAALGARGEIMGLLRTVVRDVATPAQERKLRTFSQTALTARSMPVLAGHVEADPVTAFARALVSAPLVRLPSINEAVRRGVAEGSPAGRTWVSAGRHAMEAEHDWRTGPPLMGADQRWAALADVAAMAQAMMILDGHLADLAGSARQPHRPLAERLATSAQSGIRVSAAMVQAVAATGDLPPYATTEPERARATVLAPRAPEHLARVQAHLGAQLRQAGELSPDSVVIVASGQATLARTAEVLLRERDAARSRFAGALAWGLEEAATGGRRLAATTPGAQEPVVQSAAMVRYLTENRQKWRAEPASVQAALTRALEASPGVVASLAELAERGAASGAWMGTGHEADGPGAYLWRAVTPADPAPRLVSGLSETAARSTTALLRATMRPDHPLPPPPREVLADVATLAIGVRPRVPQTSVHQATVVER